MNDPIPSPAVRAAAWESERQRKIAAAPIVNQYDRGLLTLDELIASLAGIRIDERGWVHPGATFPSATVDIYRHLLNVEVEHGPTTDDLLQFRVTETASAELQAIIKARRATLAEAIDDEHSHGGTPTLDDGCGR